MILKEFIENLQTIQKEHGDNHEVVMADCVPVVRPIFSDDYNGKSRIVVTDK